MNINSLIHQLLHLIFREIIIGMCVKSNGLLQETWSHSKSARKGNIHTAKSTSSSKIKKIMKGGGPMIKIWDQEVCFFYGLMFESCGCSYDGHWRLT